MNRNTLFIVTLAASLLLFVALLAVSVSGSKPSDPVFYYFWQPQNTAGLETFKSGAELVETFKNSTEPAYPEYADGVRSSTGMPMLGAAPAASTGWNKAGGMVAGQDYSTTNVQVAGVDEADIIKTDGTNIYLVSKGRLIIAKVYPPGDAKVLSNTSFGNFTPNELFISGDRLLLFGSGKESCYEPWVRVDGKSILPSRCPSSFTSVRLVDISDLSNPGVVKTIDIEGNYMTARMIGDYAYFVINTRPYVARPEVKNADEIIPLYRVGSGAFQPVAEATDIRYIPPKSISSFVTICSLSMKGTGGDLVKETIAGSGQELYASPDNLYITKSSSPYYYREGSAGNETTSIVKFHLANGQISSAGTGKVPGHLLNQFSMDEHDGYFRIATTRGSLFDEKNPSTNNIYVLDNAMNTVGSLEGLAPGEKIYSTRFMDSRCYMVTFKKVDPLFVIDLSDPRNPQVLGKLKIPGYSDYLHPFDETHIIGIGKEAIDASEEQTSSRSLDFAWYQGVKMALFDVSDVEHPKELYKVVIGDRGTDSPVLTDHRAFLFDKSTGLLVLPVTVAEIEGERTSDNQYGDFVFQGAYVYDLSLANGFVLRGKVTQYESNDVFKKSGLYFHGDRSIMRSLFIRDVLYTMSQSRLQLNDLNTLEKLKAIEL
ncbi:beta-propeller domain-containing protein [Methanocella sp. MCL-LM]|uniref:beta-propeller domain-containing protein n=1 Tax=Methanocella sp. MCL-LM TaxID=3412035 RepID=UPI003C7638B8